MEEESENKPRNKGLSTFARFTGFGLQMGVAVFLMNYLGKWLDRKYPSETFNYTTILTLFAVFGMTYSVIRQVVKMGKENDGEDNSDKKKTL